MRFRTKLIGLIVILSMLMLLTATVFGEGSMDITVKPGFEGAYKLGNWTPFVITLDNKGSDFEGRIQFSTAMTYNRQQPERMAYSVPVKLAAGEKKDFRLDAYMAVQQKKLYFQVLKKDKVVQEKEVQLDRDAYQTNTPFIGILTDDKNSLQYLAGLKTNLFANAGLEIFRFDKSSLPSNDKLLHNFNIIVINNFDTSQMNDTQKKSLVNWVKDGGMLVIGTGQNWKKVLGGLPNELADIDVKGEKTVDESLPLGKYAQKEAYGSMVVVNGSIKRGYTYLQGTAEPLIINYNLGRGNVVTLTFDPGSRFMENWVGNRPFWGNFITGLYTPQQQKIIEGQPSDSYYFNGIPQSEMPSVWWIIVLLVFYIGIVGMANYIVLRKLDKRDLMWITIPAISLVALLIIYVSGFSTRFDAPVISGVSVLDADLKSGAAHVDTYMTVFSPYKGTLRLSTDNSETLQLLPDFYGYYAGGYSNDEAVDAQKGEIVTHLDLSKPPALEYFNLKTWDSKKFTMEKDINWANNPEINLEMDGDIIKGKLKNPLSTALKDVVLNVGSCFIELGDINPGQTKEIQFDVKSSAKTDFARFVDKRYSNNPAKKSSKEEQDKNIRNDILRRFENKIVSNSVSTNGLTTATIFGWYDDPAGLGIIANGKKPKAFTWNLFTSKVDVASKKDTEGNLPDMGVVR